MKEIIRDYKDSKYGYMVKITPMGVVEPISKPSLDYLVEKLGSEGYIGSGYEFLGKDIMVLYNPNIVFDPKNPNRNDGAQHIMFDGHRNETHELYTRSLPMSVKGDIYIDAWSDEPFSREYIDSLLDSFEKYLSIFD